MNSQRSILKIPFPEPQRATSWCRHYRKDISQSPKHLWVLLTRVVCVSKPITWLRDSLPCGVKRGAVRQWCWWRETCDALSTRQTSPWMDERKRATPKECQKRESSVSLHRGSKTIVSGTRSDPCWINTQRNKELPHCTHIIDPGVFHQPRQPIYPNHTVHMWRGIKPVLCGVHSHFIFIGKEMEGARTACKACALLLVRFTKMCGTRAYCRKTLYPTRQCAWLDVLFPVWWIYIFLLFLDSLIICADCQKLQHVDTKLESKSIFSPYVKAKSL